MSENNIFPGPAQPVDVDPDTAEMTARRVALLKLGYHVVPAKAKEVLVKGWTEPDYGGITRLFQRRKTPVENIEMWPLRFPNLRSTGVRIDDHLRVIDIDCDDGALVEQLMAFIMKVAPDIADNAPTRFGGGEHKMALFCRFTDDAGADDQFLTDRLSSHKYVRPGEDESHCIEIFTGKPGRCSRHFGVHGPHSHNPDGTVKRWYEWDPDFPLLHETPPEDLPILSKDTAQKIVDQFDALALSAGWTQIVLEQGEHSEAVYDITETSRFDCEGGPDQISYDELVHTYYERGDFRCSSSFTDPSAVNRSKCWVTLTGKHSCVSVFNHETRTWHYPADKKPLVDDAFMAGLAEQIRKLAADHEAAIPRAAPQWRERYVVAPFPPKATLHNARLAIEHAGFICSTDVFHNKSYIGRGDAAPPRALLLSFIGEISDASLLALRVWLSDQYGLDFTEKHVRDAAVGLAWENKFNPVIDMLAEAQANWDRKPRLDRMAADYLCCEDTALNSAFVRKTMIAAVARARLPGCKFDTILTMESPEGWNKSSAWLVMAGGSENFSDESIIGKASREVQEQLAGIWIHENAELAGMRKADIDMVKAFASRTVDRARPAYGRFQVEQPRHSIEVGTTNATEYLLSGTGNRRFWPLRLARPIDLAKLRSVRLQLWGEAAYYQAQGEGLTLDPLLWVDAAVEQEDRRVKDPWEALLAGMTLKPDGGPTAGVYIGNGVVHHVGAEHRVVSSVIFRHVLEIQAGQLNDGHGRRLANVMRSLGWTKKSFMFEGKTVRGYVKTTE